MSLIVDIPVTGNTAGDEVRVRVATTLDDAEAPAEDSQLWHVIAKVLNEDLPATVSTSPRPRGTVLWFQMAAFEDGGRVSNWSTAQSVEIPLLADVSGLGISLGQDGADHELIWTPNALAGGLRIRWGVAEPGEDVELGDPVDRDASDESHSFSALVPAGDTLHVSVDVWTEFSAGAVAGEVGHTRTAAARRPRDGALKGTLDPAGDLACRVTFDNDGLLVFDNDHCLVLANPE